MAIKWAIEALQTYLSNNPFNLLMDHAPLQWLHKVKDHKPRVLRWYLLPFSFQIQHRWGTANANADYLSQQFEDTPNFQTPRGGYVA